MTNTKESFIRGYSYIEKIPYQQTEKYGCGILVLANLLNDQNIAKESDNFKNGSTVLDEILLLKTHNYDLGISSLYSCSREGRKQEYVGHEQFRMFRDEFTSGIKYNEYIAFKCHAISHKRKKTLHSILILMSSTDQVFVIDPHYGVLKLSKIENLRYCYKIVFVGVFTEIGTDRTAIFDNLKHLGI